MLEHLKLFDPRRILDPRAEAMWRGVTFATMVWVPTIMLLVALGK